MDKECSKCKETKPIDDFGKGTGPNSYWCRKCNAQYARDWRKSNPEKMKEEHRRKYKKRIEEDPDWNRKEYLKRKESRDEEAYQRGRREYRQKNKERI